MGILEESKNRYLLFCWVKLELLRPKLFRLVVDDLLLGEAESDLQEEKVKMRLEALLAVLLRLI